MPVSQGVVGASRSTVGQTANVALGRDNDQLSTELHARYYEQTFRGNTYSASNQSVATTTLGLNTTYTGLVVSNPIGSGINMALTKASVMQSVIQATQPEAFAVAVGYNSGANITHTAALTPRSNLIGSGLTPKGLADTSAGLVSAPFYHTFVQNTGSATTLGPGGVIDFEGSVILIPGAYACWVTPAQASVAGMWFSFSWEEIPTS